MEFFEIKLYDRNKNLKGIALISLEDVELVTKYNWSYTTTGRNNYVMGYVDKKHTTLHKLLLGKPEQGMVIDHINGNGLDNRRCNLRIITYSNNNQSIIKKGGSSKYLGVSFINYKKKWHASHANKVIGDFDKEIDAAYCYNIYVLNKYKDNAKLNEFELIDNQEYYDNLKEKTLKIIDKHKNKIINNMRNIRITNTGKIQFRTTINNKYISKTFNSLQQAIEYREIIEKNKNIRIAPPIIKDINNVAIIELFKNNKSYGYCKIDFELWEKIAIYKGIINSSGYPQTRINHKMIMMHKLICNGDIIDHINGDKLDNRLSNLRSTSISSNNQNKPLINFRRNTNQT